jgi:hypothetical protein
MLNRNTEKIFEGDDDLSKKYRDEKIKFEAEFVRINCEIQNIRSENETLLDEIKIREDHLQVRLLDLQLFTAIGSGNLRKKFIGQVIGVKNI